MKAGKYVSMVHAPFTTTLWAIAPRIKAATTKCGYTWTSLTITGAMNRVKGTSNDFSSKKGEGVANDDLNSVQEKSENAAREVGGKPHRR